MLISVWYSLSFIQYSYYCDFVCSWPASWLHNWHRHVRVCYIHTTKIKVACMSLLLLSIDLRQISYFIMFYFKLNNGAMEKCWVVKCCYGEIKNSTGHLFSHNDWICLFVSFSNTTFFLTIKNKQALIWYYNASSYFFIFETLRLKNYIKL